MLSEEKIKIMTNLAMFEKHEGKKIAPAYKYFKSDYVSGKLMRSFFGYTVSFILCLALWVLCFVEQWLTTMDFGTVLDYGMQIGVIYIAGLAIYLIISLVVYSKRYNNASRGIKVYLAKLKRLDKRYESGTRPGARSKGGRTP